MRIHQLSDLHFEFLSYSDATTLVNDICNIQCDVRVLVGDIACSWWTPAVLERIAYKSKVPLIAVLGNHDFYGKEPDYYKNKVLRSAEDYGYHVLDRNTVIVQGKRFVGCTGWYTTTPGSTLNDTSQVSRDAKTWIPVEGAKDRRFLEEMVTEGDIILTHYPPHVRSIPPQFVGDVDTYRYYLVDHAELIEERKPSLWLHGHTHYAVDYTLDCGTRIVANPRGYPGHEKVAGFSMKKVVRI